MAAGKTVTGQLVKVGLVVIILVFILSILMPALTHVRKAGIEQSLETESSYDIGRYGLSSAGSYVEDGLDDDAVEKPVENAIVESFDAEINLTPKHSVGTASPESIYQAEFKAKITAKAPKEQGECQMELPLPPQVISLANLEIMVNGESSESFELGMNKLLWRGQLDTEKASEISVIYSAIGKGVYVLQKPSGKVIDSYKTKLIADRRNIRMLELSLQPNKIDFSSNKTTYMWEYKKLVVARPIAVDVLGIAAIDRLGELTWLGPLSVLIFGVLIALVALAYDPDKVTGWVLVLLVGTFSGAYPFMYFMQDFVSLESAIGISSLIIVIILAWRMLSLCGFRYGIFGGVILPIIVLGFTVATAIISNRSMQGVILTAMSIFAFVVAMVLLPIAQNKITAREENVNKSLK